jgi:hypothetical protein
LTLGHARTVTPPAHDGEGSAKSQPRRLPDRNIPTGEGFSFAFAKPLLQRNALKSQASGAARTYIITAEQTVVGYYALAVG